MSDTVCIRVHCPAHPVPRLHSPESESVALDGYPATYFSKPNPFGTFDKVFSGPTTARMNLPHSAWIVRNWTGSKRLLRAEDVPAGRRSGDQLRNNNLCYEGHRSTLEAKRDAGRRSLWRQLVQDQVCAESDQRKWEFSFGPHDSRILRRNGLCTKVCKS